MPKPTHQLTMQRLVTLHCLLQSFLFSIFNLAIRECIESEKEGAIETTLSDIFNLDYSAHFNH